MGYWVKRLIPSSRSNQNIDRRREFTIRDLPLQYVTGETNTTLSLARELQWRLPTEDLSHVFTGLLYVYRKEKIRYFSFLNRIVYLRPSIQSQRTQNNPCFSSRNQNLSSQTPPTPNYTNWKFKKKKKNLLFLPIQNKPSQTFATSFQYFFLILQIKPLYFFLKKLPQEDGKARELIFPLTASHSSSHTALSNI